MAAPLATAADVETSLLRPLTTLEQLYVTATLSRAESLLLSYDQTLLERAAAGTWLHSTIVRVEADMVARVFRNPDGKRQESDGTYSFSVDWAVSSGRLKPLDDELRDLGLRTSIGTSAGAMDGYAQQRYANVHPTQNEELWHPIGY